MVALGALCRNEASLSELAGTLLYQAKAVDAALVKGDTIDVARIIPSISIPLNDPADSRRLALILRIIVLCLTAPVSSEKQLDTKAALADNHQQGRVLGLS